MNYTKEQVDYIHDVLTDLLCSCMASGMEKKRFEAPEVGDWCYEYSSIGKGNQDCRIGVLKQIISESEFVTETVGGREIHWNNAALIKIPQQLLRRTETPSQFWKGAKESGLSQ